jgi:hypothetical protein
MKTNLSFLSFAAYGMMMDSLVNFDGSVNDRSSSEIDVEKMNKLRRAREEKRKHEQGLKLFNINGVEVWARNYKNAIRKSKLK